MSFSIGNRVNATSLSAGSGSSAFNSAGNVVVNGTTGVVINSSGKIPITSSTEVFLTAPLVNLSGGNGVINLNTAGNQSQVNISAQNILLNAMGNTIVNGAMFKNLTIAGPSNFLMIPSHTGNFIKVANNNNTYSITLPNIQEGMWFTFVLENSGTGTITITRAGSNTLFGTLTLGANGTTALAVGSSSIKFKPDAVAGDSIRIVSVGNGGSAVWHVTGISSNNLGLGV